MGRGEGQTLSLVRRVEDRIEARPVDGGLVLISYTPAPERRGESYRDDPYAAFVAEKDFQEAQESGDPVSWLNSREVPKYHLLSEDGMKYFLDTAYEEDMDRYEKGFVQDKKLAQIVESGELSPERVVRVDEGHMFFRPGEEKPLSRVYAMEVWGTHFDVRKALEKASKHPWAINPEVYENRVRQNYGISGRELMTLRFKMPQEEHDKVWELLSTDQHGYMSPERLREVFEWAVRDNGQEENEWGKERREKLEKLGIWDPFGLREFSIPDHDYSEEDHWDRDWE